MAGDNFGFVESEALLKDWYSRDGLEPSHERNLELLARLFAVHMVAGMKRPLGELLDEATLFLIAAYQIGRGSK